MARRLVILLALTAFPLAALADPPSVPTPKTIERPANPLHGAWETEGLVLVFGEKSLRVDVPGAEGRPALLAAEYSVTKDGIVYGIISRETLSAQFNLPSGSFVDETFRFRVHVEGNELTVKTVRLPIPRAPGRASTGVESVDEPFRAVELGMPRVEGSLAGTYERTTPEAAGKRRLPAATGYKQPSVPRPVDPNSGPAIDRNR